MSLSGSKDSSSSGSRGNPPNGRKRRLSSRSRTSSSLSGNNTRTISSYSVNRDSKRKENLSPAKKKGRLSSSVGSTSQHSDLSPISASYEAETKSLECANTSGCTDCCGFSQPSSSTEPEANMAFTSPAGQSPFGNNFVKGGINNHRRPGQGKKIVIKNRKGKGSSVL